jgi:hypothetical protein
MLAALRQVMPPRRFLQQTFFTNTALYTTKKVDLDIYKGKRRIAAYINPIAEGRVVERQGYETYTVEPAYVKEKIPTRVQDTMVRVMGENPYTPSSPQARAAALLGQDLAFLDDRLMRREEEMCAEVLFNGGVHVVGEGVDNIVSFGYESGVHYIVLTGTDCFDIDGSDPQFQIDQWRMSIIQRSGITPNVLIVGSEVYWAIINNKTFLARLDNRRVEMGIISPENLPNGVRYLGMMVPAMLDIWVYDEWYTDPTTGNDIPMVPPDAVLLGSTQARAEMAYGLIQNMFFLDAATRFPYSWIEKDGTARWVQLEAAPMPNLYQVDAFLTARVLSTSSATLPPTVQNLGGGPAGTRRIGTGPAPIRSQTQREQMVRTDVDPFRGPRDQRPGESTILADGVEPDEAPELTATVISRMSKDELVSELTAQGVHVQGDESKAQLQSRLREVAGIGS